MSDLRLEKKYNLFGLLSNFLIPHILNHACYSKLPVDLKQLQLCNPLLLVQKVKFGSLHQNLFLEIRFRLFLR